MVEVARLVELETTTTLTPFDPSSRSAAGAPLNAFSPSWMTPHWSSRMPSYLCMSVSIDGWAKWVPTASLASLPSLPFLPLRSGTTSPIALRRDGDEGVPKMDVESASRISVCYTSDIPTGARHDFSCLILRQALISLLLSAAARALLLAAHEETEGERTDGNTQTALQPRRRRQRSGV